MERATFWDTRRCRATGLALSLAWAFCAFPPISFEGTFWAGLSPVAQMALRLALVGFLPSLLIPLMPRIVQQGRARLVAIVAAIVLWGAGWLGNVILDASAPLLLRFAALFCTGAGSAYFLVYWGLRFCKGEEEASELDFVTVIVLAGILIIAAHLVVRSVLDVFLAVTPLLQGALLILEARQSRQPSEGASVRVDRPPVPSGSFGRQLSALLLRTALAVALVGFVWCMFSMNSTSFFQPEMHLFGFGFLLAGAAIWLFVKFSPSIGFVAATRWVLPMMALGLLCNAGSAVVSLVAACLLLSMAHATFEMLLRMQVVRFGRLYPERQVMAVGWGFSAIMLGAFAGPSLYLLVMDSGIVDDLHLALWMLAILVVVGSVLFAMPDKMGVGAILFEGSVSSGDGETDDAARTRRGNGSGAGSPGEGEVRETAPSLQQRAQQLAERFGLTAREREILTLLLEGRSRPYIRDTLYLSISTVDTHIRHIYAKAGVHNKQELIDLSQTEEL